MYVSITDKKTGDIVFEFFHVVGVESCGGSEIQLWIQDSEGFASVFTVKLDQGESIQCFRICSDHSKFFSCDVGSFNCYDLEADCYQ